jgi:exonuclease III
MAEEQKTLRVVSWNVNGLYSTLKDAASRYQSASYYFSDVLRADIVCFQEAKIQEEKLEKWMAFVPSYDSYWAFSQEKKGYSGKWKICVSLSSMLKKALVFSNGFVRNAIYHVWLLFQSW